jgi:hypothetical protein
MNIRPVHLLSISQGYMKACIPFIAILLSLISSSLTLACPPNQTVGGTAQIVGGTAMQSAYVRVWNPDQTRSIKLDCFGCNGNRSACINNSTLGQYYDIGWQGELSQTLTITAYDQQGCKGSSKNSTSSTILSPGDCWFDLPRQLVSGACTQVVSGV